MTNDSMNAFSSVASNFIHPEDDSAWIDFIWSNIIEYYNSINNKSSFASLTEKEITQKIYFHLDNKKSFRRKVFVNSEPRSNNEDIEGYYDLKFESHYWRQGDVHYVIENKILDHTQTSIKEYTYYPNKSKTKKGKKTTFNDGGMYRFLSNKYAVNMSYAGMMAFVKGNNINTVIDNVKEEIKKLSISGNNTSYGKLLDEKLLNKKVNGFQYSFLSSHTKIDKTDIEFRHFCLVFN
ncbi:hypothetical protein ACT3CE_15665 [Marinifilum sp. RC60d5]|uniref:hypothetical protein n=1 Tax=Marinifilum sp. RC60d5 TaxID=3458414 RepID=UPI0040362E7D